jgi:hypothetical protein
VQVDCYFFQFALACGGKHGGEDEGQKQKLQGGTSELESYGWHKLLL